MSFEWKGWAYLLMGANGAYRLYGAIWRYPAGLEVNFILNTS